MPNLRSASLCALSAFVLFSCNNSSSDRSIAKDEATIKDSQGVKMLPKEDADISLYRKKFIDAATQRFSVSAKRTTLLKSKAGLKITVDPSVLEKENGGIVKDNIDISIIELTNSSDLFKSNAATVSNGKLLISGGSYFIDMQSGGDKLKIKKDQSLQVDFPLLEKGDMELFYGERNVTGDMNWVQTGNNLQKEYETIAFNTASNQTYIPVPNLSLNQGHYLYNSVNAKVNYIGKMMTIKQMVDILQNKGIDKIIDTVYYRINGGCYSFNKVSYGRSAESLWGNYTGMQFRIISSKESKAEKDSLQEIYCNYKEKLDNQKIKEDLITQIRKNYAPANIKTLGWINCDRFYNPQQQTETNIELPYAFNNANVQYFILFKSFNGLLNGAALTTENTKFNLQNLPIGESITLIAFTKKNGVLYQGKQDFVVERNKKLPLDFKEISGEEMTKLFGSNVKI